MLKKTDKEISTTKKARKFKKLAKRKDPIVLVCGSGLVPAPTWGPEGRKGGIFIGCVAGGCQARGRFVSHKTLGQVLCRLT